MSEASQVLADLYEEVTGDLNKRWPATWMAASVMREAKRTRNVDLYHLAASVAIEADVDTLILAEAVDMERLIWMVVDRDPQRIIAGDLSGKHYFWAEVAIRQMYYHTVDVYRFELTPYSDDVGWKDRDRRSTIRISGVPLYDAVDRSIHQLEREHRERLHTNAQFIDDINDSDPRVLFEAYHTIAAHWGYSVLDPTPLILHGEARLNQRWGRFPFKRVELNDG